MYLCDLMASLAQSFKNPVYFQEARKLPSYPDVQRVVEFASNFIADEQIKMYSYDRSALLAAGDLRVDRQNDIEKIADLIFQKPRKVFIEANYLDREKAFSRVKMMPDTGNPMIGKPVRVGNLFDIKGDGKATMHVVWTTPKSEIKKSIPEVMRECGVLKSTQRTIINAQSLNVSSHYLEIDTHKKSKISFGEFVELSRDPSTEQFSMLEYANKSNISRDLSEAKKLKEAYDLFRLNSIAEMHFDRANIERLSHLSSITGISPSEIMGTLQSDLDGELVLGVGMLAILELDELNIQVRTDGRQRIRDAKGKSRWVKPQRTDYEKPLLSVVNMNIGEELVSALYSETSSAPEERRSHHDGNRQSPALHPVRGHMFRARNGKIVYRKPHFRGKSSRRSITRVTA